jgi:hypothetical protein
MMQSVVVGFLYIEILHCHFEFILYLFIVISKKIRVLFYSLSSVNSGLLDIISVMLVSINLYTVKISSTYLK